MASPQKENGHLRIANELLEAFAKTNIGGKKRQILDFIIRKTYGYNKKEDRISLSQFSKGTGIVIRDVCRCINQLTTMKIIIKIQDDLGNVYSLNKDYEQWTKLSVVKNVSGQKCSKGTDKNANYPLTKMPHTIDNIQKTINKRDFFTKNPSLSNSLVSPDELKKLPVENKTHKDFTNALRAEKGKPPLTPKKLTLNQINFITRSSLVDYYKQAVNSKYNKSYFTHPSDIDDIEKENSKMSMQIKIFYQRCIDDNFAREVIDFFAGDYGKFFEWKPNGCFRKDTIIDFENRKNKPNKTNTIQQYGKEWRF